jgi:hypothetical protein
MEAAVAAVAGRNKNTFSAPGKEREPLREKNGKNGAGASVRKGEVKKGSATREGSPAR